MRPGVPGEAAPPGDDIFRGLLPEVVQQVLKSKLDRGDPAGHSLAMVPVQFLDNASDHLPAALTMTPCWSCAGYTTR